MITKARSTVLCSRLDLSLLSFSFQSALYIGPVPLLRPFLVDSAPSASALSPSTLFPIRPNTERTSANLFFLSTLKPLRPRSLELSILLPPSVHPDACRPRLFSSLLSFSLASFLVRPKTEVISAHMNLLFPVYPIFVCTSSLFFWAELTCLDDPGRGVPAQHAAVLSVLRCHARVSSAPVKGERPSPCAPYLYRPLPLAFSRPRLVLMAGNE